MKKFLVLAALLCLCACAAKTPHEVSGDAASIWQSMLKNSAAPEPYRMQMSMRFGEEGDTRRVTAILWGNGNEDMRLDVMAGVGATIAKVSESGDEFLLYAPRENRAYYHNGASRPLLKIGVPVPFDLQQLAMLLNGRFGQVFGPDYDQAKINGAGNGEFTLSGPFTGMLTVNQKGAPLLWKQQTGGWTLKLSYDEDNPLLPQKAELTNLNGKRAILLIKERDKLSKPFDAKQLQLEIPAGAQKLPLADYKPA